MISDLVAKCPAHVVCTSASPTEGPVQLLRVPRTTIGVVGRLHPQCFLMHSPGEGHRGEPMDHPSCVVAVDNLDAKKKLLWQYIGPVDWEVSAGIQAATR